MAERTAKKTAAKKATVRRSETKAKPEKSVEHPLGSTVELEVDEDATEVVVERPDGSEITVYASGGRALYVLDQVGVHVAGGLAIDATAVEESK